MTKKPSWTSVFDAAARFFDGLPRPLRTHRVIPRSSKPPKVKTAVSLRKIAVNRFDQNLGFRNCTNIQLNRELIRGKNRGRLNRGPRRTHREVKNLAVYRCSRSADFTVKYDSWIVTRMQYLWTVFVVSLYFYWRKVFCESKSDERYTYSLWIKRCLCRNTQRTV